MATQTPDTKNDQDRIQARYDREFNDIVGHSKTASDLREQETQAGNASDFDEWEKELAGDQKSAKSPRENIADAKESEQAGGWKSDDLSPPEKSKGKVSGWRRKGPLAAIGGIIAIMGYLGFSGLTLMPITIAEHFTNDRNSANNSSQRKFIHLFGKKTGSDFRKRLSICGKVISFRCQLKTAPINLVQSFEDEGKFKFHDKTVSPDGKRIGFSAIEFPDGTVAHDGGELKAILKKPGPASQAFNRMYSIKNSLFFSKWFSNVLRGFNLTKAKKIEGKTKSEADKSYEASTKGEKGTVSTNAVADNPGDNATEEQKKAAAAANGAGDETSKTINKAIAAGKKLKKLSLRVANALAIPQLACLTYNMFRYIAATAKIKIAMRFAGFAMIFLTLASTIKANKATEAEVAKGMDVLSPSSYPTKVEDPETGQMIDNPNIGKNALDSEAYKVVAYGDQINLTGIAKRFFVAGGFLGVLQKVVATIDRFIGKNKVKTACKIVNSTVATIISFLAAPLIAGIFALAGQLLPVDEWAAALVNAAIDAAAGPDFTTGIKGVDAGNVLFIGAATILGGSAIKFGLKPGKLDAIRKNMAANHELLQQEIAQKTYEASKTPLDITNRYSFLGSMAFQLASFVPNMQNPLISSASKLLSTIPTSFTMLTKNASAAYSMPVADYSETRFSQCKNDEDYNAMKEYFTPDMFCVLDPVPDNEKDVDVVWNYLENTGNIDKIQANPMPGSFTEKYLRYCVNRTDPWGSTSVAAEEQNDDPKWYTGEKCFITDKSSQQEKDDINMTSEYVGYKISEETIDSYPKTNPNPPAQEAFWGAGNSLASDDSTYSAISRGMSYVLQGAR